MLAAVAELQGRPMNAAATTRAQRGRADYEAWLLDLDAVTRAPFQHWDGLVRAVSAIVGDKAITLDDTGYISPGDQDDLLGIEGGSLPPTLAALGFWASMRHSTTPRVDDCAHPAGAEADGPLLASYGAPLPNGPAAGVPSPVTVAQGQMLSLGEILAVRAGKYGPTIVDVPRHHRRDLADLLQRWLTEAVDLLRGGHGTMPTLLWAPRLLLAGNPLPHDLAFRLRKARRGLWRDVLADVEAHKDQRLKPRTTPSRRLTAARTLFSRGEVSKGLATLARNTTSGPQPTEAELRAKFPPPPISLPATAPFLRADSAITSALRVDIERAAHAIDTEKHHGWSYWVHRALLRPRWSCAHGPDGLRYAHLRQLVVLPDVGPRIIALTEQLVDLVASGRYCPNLQDVSITAVPKPEGGIRPIGVSSIWRRMPMFIAASQLDIFTPAMVDLGQFATAPAGPQIFARRTRRCVEAGLFVARLDIRNAFGCVDRVRVITLLESMLAEARTLRRDTGALRAVRAAYGAAEDSYWTPRRS